MSGIPFGMEEAKDVQNLYGSGLTDDDPEVQTTWANHHHNHNKAILHCNHNETRHFTGNRNSCQKQLRATGLQ